MDRYSPDVAPIDTSIANLLGIPPAKGETMQGQRYALLPVELRLENRAGMGVATLRVVMIDSRMALLKGMWEVSSDPTRTVSPALTASVATHFADLVVAP